MRGFIQGIAVSTRSRPKAAAELIQYNHQLDLVSTHSRPKAAAIFFLMGRRFMLSFQHTAARRRLHDPL